MKLDKADYLFHCHRCDLRAVFGGAGGSLGCKGKVDEMPEHLKGKWNQGKTEGPWCPNTSDEVDIFKFVESDGSSDAGAELEFFGKASDLEGSR